MSEPVPVARLGDLPEDTGTVVEVQGRQVALFRTGGDVRAYENVCLHRGGPVGEGDVDGGVVTCPWHGWQYDVATGEHVLDRSIGLIRYEAIVRDGHVLVVPP